MSQTFESPFDSIVVGRINDSGDIDLISIKMVTGGGPLRVGLWYKYALPEYQTNSNFKIQTETL